jgi:MFS transporter, PAT family, beta-lactamase induction signal transducer AmpG
MSDTLRVARAHGWKAYFGPRAAAMLALGFSSGLPFLLVGNTLGYWLRDEGTTLSAIGFLSAVGIAYSLKFLWAPLIDRANAPLLGFLGRRRGWMALAQIIVGLALIAMAIAGTAHGLMLLGALALVVAFASATQDIVIDAWRIESAENGEELGLLSSAYQLGYRIALIATDALILVAANHLGWPVSYGLYGALMGIGFAATLLASEPARADAVIDAKDRAAPLWSLRGLADAIIGPFIVFFRTWGVFALLMLLAISLYRLPDFVMGPMANPLYHDIGLSKDWVGAVRGSIGLIASFAGIAAGGFWALRFGYMSALIMGGILQAVAVAAFASLAFMGPIGALHATAADPHLRLFAAVMAGDNFGISFAGVALVSYMSSLTSLGYTATQYALLSSSYAWVGKLTKPFSGAVVESLTPAHGLMGAYAIFFIAAGAIGIPAVLLFILLETRQRAAQSRLADKKSTIP